MKILKKTDQGKKKLSNITVRSSLDQVKLNFKLYTEILTHHVIQIIKTGNKFRVNT